MRILSIDPGKGNTGWSISDYDLKTKKLKVKEVATFSASNIVNRKEFKEEVVQYGGLISLFIYEKEIDQLIRTYNPDIVVSEDAFYNPRRPQAYLSLKLCINSIERVAYAHGKAVTLLAPKLIKHTTYGKGTANKEDMISKVKNLKDLTLDKKIILNEHMADAVSVAYTYVRLHI